jgi:hypothetical protein
MGPVFAGNITKHKPTLANIHDLAHDIYHLTQYVRPWPEHGKCTVMDLKSLMLPALSNPFPLGHVTHV